VGARTARRRRLVGPVVGLALLALVGASCGGDDTSARSTSTTRVPTSSTAPSSAPATSAPTTAAPTSAPPPTTARSATAAGAYSFPVQPTAGGRATYARSHHDYPAADIFAACGSIAVAPVGGVVQELSRTDSWNPKVNSGDTRGGLFVSLVGDDGVRYYGSHLREVDASLSPGVRVARGQRLGAVGDTGDAKGVGCHLHFGISAPCGPADWERRRGEVWPQPYLDAWRTGTARSPVTEVSTRRC
jgi:murein DD-endopeptidase MepM/ murein hydrolase activator NlpD